jgi:hypothetical protein
LRQINVGPPGSSSHARDAVMEAALDFLHFVIGAPPLPLLKAPPADAQWTQVRSKRDPRTVRATLATAKGVLKTHRGRARYEPGSHYIVEYAPRDRALVVRDIFERIYEPIGQGRYKKRSGLLYRYFTLPFPAWIATAEGKERAEAGDWIVQGVMGEIYPVSPERAQEIYEPAV